MTDKSDRPAPNPSEYLASELYRKSELLDPDSETPWQELFERKQRFYRLLVDHLLAFPDVVRAALDYACDHEAPPVSSFTVPRAGYEKVEESGVKMADELVIELSAPMIDAGYDVLDMRTQGSDCFISNDLISAVTGAVGRPVSLVDETPGKRMP